MGTTGIGSTLKRSSFATGPLLAMAGRPSVLFRHGAAIFVGIRDLAYLDKLRTFKRELAAAHPDAGGQRFAFLAVQKRYERWKGDEAHWYASIGLEPPRLAPPVNVFRAMERALLEEACRLSGGHGPTAARLLGISKGSLSQRVMRHRLQGCLVNHGGAGFTPRPLHASRSYALVLKVLRDTLPNGLTVHEVVMAVNAAGYDKSRTAIESAVRELFRTGRIRRDRKWAGRYFYVSTSPAALKAS